MNMMGPQWLCDCNASEEHATLAMAEKTAGQHYLSHGEGTSVSVAVYRKRGDWEYSISTREQAEKTAMPLLTVAEGFTAILDWGVGRYGQQEPPPIRESDPKAFAEAQHQMMQIFAESLRGPGKQPYRFPDIRAA
jgi:hypothetical protein